MKLVTILLFISTQTIGQRLGMQEIDAFDIQPWNPKDSLDYQGVYHFGDSEWESELFVLFCDGQVYAQIKSGSWSMIGDTLSQVFIYKNLHNVSIAGSRFQSDETNGEFVIYDDDMKKIKGLKIARPWSEIPGNGQWEFGPLAGDINGFKNGDFPQASLKRLNKADLAKSSEVELRLMRNEIFARYGLQFRRGGEMDRYFRNQPWYRGQHDNVDKFLTELERDNIKIIQSVENP